MSKKTNMPSPTSVASSTPNGSDHTIVSCSPKSQSFASLPLFLPRNVTYNPRTNVASDPRHTNSNHRHGTTNPEYDEQLVLVPNAGLDMIARVNKPIGCVSCVGPYRTGKSLLLSRFLKDSKAFKVGPTLEGCTRGIWISTSAIIQNDGSYTFLLDCEGTGDPLEGSETSNARIALTCILTSSVFLYNNTGRPDRSTLQFLSYLNTVRSRIPLSVGGGGGGGGGTGTAGGNAARNFPSFVWVFRDFFLQLPVRKDTNKPYTLKEYMLERVLVKSGSGSFGNHEDGVIDALLNDFQSFDVQSIGYPKRGELPFQPEEMSELDSVPWEEIDEEFRGAVEETIRVCLSRAGPFRLGGDGKNDLGPVAHGPLFASWLNRVVELVNSNEIIPDIPNMQQRLMQDIADEKVNGAIAGYAKRIDKYLDECPVYNDDVEKERDGMILAASMIEQGLIKGEGVAEDRELERYSLGILVELCKGLGREITSEKLLDESMERVKQRCIKDEHGSVLAQLRETNGKRSRESCEAIARMLHSKFREIVRSDATKMNSKQFEAGAKQVETRFRAIARGPAVDETAKTFLQEQKDADKVFLDRVNSINALYKETLTKKEQLDKDVKEKNMMVTTLKTSIEKLNADHMQQVERINTETQEKMKTMASNHTAELNAAIEKQKKAEEENLNQLKADMDRRLKLEEEAKQRELKRKEEEREAAEQRLADEIAARDARLRREEEAHKEEIQKLLKTADTKMKAEIEAAERKREEDKARYELQMNKKLNEQNLRMEEELKAREAKLEEEEKRHKAEIERVQKELNAKMDQQKNKYLKEIEELEKECFRFKACSIQ